MTTVFLLGPSGTAQEVTVPTNVHAFRLYEERLASGEFRIVDRSDLVERKTRHGGTVLVVKSGDDPAPRKKVAAKVAADSDD